MTRLSRRGISYSVARTSEVRRQAGLTARQEWLLRSALELGYFDSPKRVRIRALAASLGVSAPTLHESLRRSQRRLIEEHVGMAKPLVEVRPQSGRANRSPSRTEGLSETTSK